jgi:hypothetical protein
MPPFAHWVSAIRSRVRAAAGADPGEAGREPSGRAAAPDDRAVLSLDDLMWFKTSEDAEGRITLGLLEFHPAALGVLVDDNGQSLGLRLSRTEAQDLHRSLVRWLAATARPMAA